MRPVINENKRWERKLKVQQSKFLSSVKVMRTNKLSIQLLLGYFAPRYQPMRPVIDDTKW